MDIQEFKEDQDRILEKIEGLVETDVVLVALIMLRARKSMLAGSILIPEEKSGV